jgi:lipase chaperone LimK
MNISAIALGGLEQAQSSLDNAAKRIASDTSLPDSKDAVILIQAKNDTASNIAVLKTADDLQKSTISLLG